MSYHSPDKEKKLGPVEYLPLPKRDPIPLWAKVWLAISVAYCIGMCYYAVVIYHG